MGKARARQIGGRDKGGPEKESGGVAGEGVARADKRYALRFPRDGARVRV